MRHGSLLVCLLLVAGCGRTQATAHSSIEHSTPFDAAAAAAPFGVEFGRPPTAYKSAEIAKWVYSVSPPQPDPAFQSFELVALPESGICILHAVSRTYKHDVSGARVRATLDQLREAFATVYGPPTKIHDDCKEPADLCARGRWTEAIYKFKRHYAFEWRDINRPGSRVGSIYMYAFTWGPTTTTYVDLQIYGDNRPLCERSGPGIP